MSFWIRSIRSLQSAPRNTFRHILPFWSLVVHGLYLLRVNIVFTANLPVFSSLTHSLSRETAGFYKNCVSAMTRDKMTHCKEIQPAGVCLGVDRSMQISLIHIIFANCYNAYVTIKMYTCLLIFLKCVLLIILPVWEYLQNIKDRTLSH